MKPVFFAVIATMCAGTIGAQQQVCPCVPLSHLWTVDTCPTWNCAASAMITANGDPFVLSMPAPSNDGRWLVLRRIAAGSYIAPADAPFLLESFEGADGATARYMAIGSDHVPMMMSVPDGKFVVVMAREAQPRRRAVQP